MTGHLRDHLDHTPPATAPKHPGGYHFEHAGDTITIGTPTTTPPQADTWRALLAAEGYDPDQYHVNEQTGVHHRKWQQTPGGEFLHYYRFTAVRNDAKAWNIDDITAAINKRRPLKPKQRTNGTALVVNLADWQAGADHGGGPAPLLERINRLGPAVTQRWRNLRQIGIGLDRLIVHSLGDMGESCDGHYPQQLYRTHLNYEEQREFVIHATDMLLDSWAQLAPIDVYAVPGNHGEHRSNGKSNTDFRDNVDVGVWVNLAHAYSKNPDRYSHIRFRTPPGQDLDLTYSHDGYLTCLIHGHQARGGGDPAKKIDTWWRGQMAGLRPAGDAQLLVSGHYHHFRLINQGPRFHAMAPALCGSQDWWTNTAGLDSPPGTLTYTLTGDGPADWQIIH